MDVNGAAEGASAKAPSQEYEERSAHASFDGIQKTSSLPCADANSASSDISTKARNFTSQILHFLSHATSETLGACIVGLAAITYLVLGRFGLILIGMFGGVILHAAWEDGGSQDEDDTKRTAESRKREKALEIIQRVLDLRDKTSHEKSVDDGGENRAVHFSSEPDFTGFQPRTKSALESFTNAVIRDYVDWWYKPILPKDTSFPLACRQTLTRFVLSVSSHLSRKRPADVFLDFLTNSSSIIVVFLSELSGALIASQELEPQEAINEYLQENPQSSLANVLDQKQQKNKLAAVAEDILQTFLDRKALDYDPAKMFLREVLAGLILDMVVAKCSSADFINEWIVYALEGSDPTELVQAIDEGVVDATNNKMVRNVAASASETASNRSFADVSSSNNQSTIKAEHKRTVSRAEQAMEEAMREAQALNEMIAAEEARRNRALEEETSGSDLDPRRPLHSHLGADEVQAIKTIPDGNIATESPPSSVSQPTAGFKSFDQILSSQQPTALKSNVSASQPPPPPPLTLYNANLTIFDDSMSGEKGTLRSKPTVEYLLQIEPSSSHYPGWMIARKYPDFERLHEVLRRISVVSGVAAFVERHQNLPSWKNKSKSNLRLDLEKYLQDALSYQRLAESESMKRFLEKEQHTGPTPSSIKQGGFGFPSPSTFENVGKGMLDVLSGAPKGAATGGKAIVGGVTGVFGGVGSLGQKKHTSKNLAGPSIGSTVASNPNLSSADDNHSHSHGQAQPSGENLKTPEATPRESIQLEGKSSIDVEKTMPSDPSQNYGSINHLNGSVKVGTVPEDTDSSEGDVGSKESSETLDRGRSSLHLPPPPSEISDDYNTSQSSLKYSLDDNTTSRTSISTAHTLPEFSQSVPESSLQTLNTPSTKHLRPDHTPLTLQETTVAVELFFATINELYTLSSAWTLRLTLLNTAKTFLLRPGNANLEAIRQLLQTTIISANTSDSGIATHISSIRANALPTEEELKTWPSPPTEEEKERRRAKARKLLVEKGMPQALTSVMGQAASREALGKVFDCLQISEVARGLVFALVLQAVKAITQ